MENLDTNSEELSVDIFEECGPFKKPQFGKTVTFGDELEALKKKYKNTQYRVYVQHMIDSLVVFTHNMKDLTGGQDAELVRKLHKIKY